MMTTLHQATPAMLDEITEAVASRQHDGMPVQIHPGDLGWNAQSGAQALAQELRVWRRDGQIAAVGMVDEASGLIRMAIAPDVDEDEAFARHLLSDLCDPDRGVLPADRGSVEARYGAAFRSLLAREGWVADESWTPLTRDLRQPVPECLLRVETLDTKNAPRDLVEDRVAVQRASFPHSTSTLERWHAMAAAPPYENARCVIGYEGNHAVAATTVRAAGPGRPGRIEPLGVHSSHRGHGDGQAVTIAAAAQLRAMGASSVRVCTPSSNVGGIATYVSADFRSLDPVTDLRRPA